MLFPIKRRFQLNFFKSLNMQRACDFFFLLNNKISSIFNKPFLLFLINHIQLHCYTDDVDRFFQFIEFVGIALNAT